MDIWYAFPLIPYPLPEGPSMTNNFTDGGGPNVISQLVIVNEIMHRIQWTLKLDYVPRPCDYAELMVGSGLGGYVTDPSIWISPTDSWACCLGTESLLSY
jgi:hypothetical protein